MSDSTRPLVNEDASLSPAAAEEHRHRSYELWQRLAAPWEKGRRTLGAPSRAVSEHLVDRLKPAPGQTLLELAAGTGETGFLASELLRGQGRLICSDFVPNMVTAAERVARQLGVQNVEFRVLDAERLALPDASVDGVLCRFGYMLMASPETALAETRRVLRAGGRLAFSVWGPPERNPWMSVPGGVMAQRGHLQLPAAGEPGMFAMRSPERIRQLLARTGFAWCDVEEIPICHRYADADDLWDFVSKLQGPIALAIARLDQAEQHATRLALEARAERFRSGTGYELPGLALSVLGS